jgi:hypothetical protein
MRTKKLVTLALILSMAVGAILLVNSVRNREPSEESLRFFPGVSEQSIGSIVLKNAQDWIKLQRRGGAWVMIPKEVLQSAAIAEKQASGLSKAMGEDTAADSTTPTGSIADEYPVDSASLAHLFETILKMKKNLLISENPAKQATFEVDTSRGVRIEVFDLAGASRGIVFSGKTGPDYNSTYCRSASSNIVYQCFDVSNYTFFPDHSRWLNKAVLRFDTATVRQLIIAKRDTSKAGKAKIVTTVIAKGDSSNKGWHMLEPMRKPADADKVNDILSTLSNFNAAEYENSPVSDSAAGITDPFIKVTVKLAGGTERVLTIGRTKPGLNQTWFKVPDKKFLFVLNDFERSKFDQKPDDLVQSKLNPIEAAGERIPAKL